MLVRRVQATPVSARTLFTGLYPAEKALSGPGNPLAFVFDSKAPAKGTRGAFHWTPKEQNAKMAEILKKHWAPIPKPVWGDYEYPEEMYTDKLLGEDLKLHKHHRAVMMGWFFFWCAISWLMTMWWEWVSPKPVSFTKEWKEAEKQMPYRSHVSDGPYTLPMFCSRRRYRPVTADGKWFQEAVSEKYQHGGDPPAVDPRAAIRY